MKRKEAVAIVGAGAAGAVTAAYLIHKGYSVILCDTKEQCEEDFEEIARKGIGVESADLPSGYYPAVLTHNIEDAMEAQRLLVCVSGRRQKEVAEWMAPYVQGDHDILLMPGNLGAVVFYRVFQEKGVTCGVLAELAECLWACRRLDAGRYVSAMPLGVRRIAAFPSADTIQALERFEDLFPMEAGGNLVEGCLNSPNVLTHLAGTLLNLGGIARKGVDFALFLDGLSDGYIRCLKLLEGERNRVLNALGMKCYAARVEPLMTMLMEETHPELDPFRRLAGPDGLRHRYITEDAPCGVALLVSSARKCHVEVPVTEALLTLTSSLTGNDYYDLGRTWEWLDEDAADIFSIWNS